MSIIMIPEHGKLLDFLLAVDQDYPVPLSNLVNLEVYAKKLREKATLSVVFVNGEIAACVAAYLESSPNEWSFVPLVGTREKYRGKGYAADCMQTIIERARALGKKYVHLYAVPTNNYALSLYKKLGFQQIKMEDDPRPNDIHLVYNVEQ